MNIIENFRLKYICTKKNYQFYKVEFIEINIKSSIDEQVKTNTSNVRLTK